MSQTLVRVGGAGHGPANAGDAAAHDRGARRRRRRRLRRPTRRRLARRGSRAGSAGARAPRHPRHRRRATRALTAAPPRPPARRAGPHAARAPTRPSCSTSTRAALVSRHVARWAPVPLDLLQDLMAHGGPLRPTPRRAMSTTPASTCGPQRRTSRSVDARAEARASACACASAAAGASPPRATSPPPAPRRRWPARSRSPRPSPRRARPAAGARSTPARGHWAGPCEQDPFAVSLERASSRTCSPPRRRCAATPRIVAHAGRAARRAAHDEGVRLDARAPRARRR